MNTILTYFKKHKSITLLALAILASTALQAMEQPKDLIEAATDGDLERVKALIANGVDVNQEHEIRSGSTALILAALNGHLEIVKTLLNAQADVNQQNKNGSTALIAAANKGHLEIVKALINAQANVNQKNKNGLTALIWAAFNGNLEIAKALINAQADVNQQNKNGSTALIVAANNGHPEIVKTLLTEFSIEDAEKIKNNFTGLLVLNRIRFMPKDVRRLITQKLIQELVDERMKRANEIMGITNENDLTARDHALTENKQEIAALLDPNNAESQQKLRAIIENKIRCILFGEPKKKEKTVELDDPFGTWDKD